MSPIRLKLCQNAFQTIPDISFFDAENKHNLYFLQALDGRLPPEHSSDRPQTLPKRVSDDLQISIFRGQKNFDVYFFSTSKICFDELPFFEDLG